MSKKIVSLTDDMCKKLSYFINAVEVFNKFQNEKALSESINAFLSGICMANNLTPAGDIQFNLEKKEMIVSIKDELPLNVLELPSKIPNKEK